MTNRTKTIKSTLVVGVSGAGPHFLLSAHSPGSTLLETRASRTTSGSSLRSPPIPFKVTALPRMTVLTHTGKKQIKEDRTHTWRGTMCTRSHRSYQAGGATASQACSPQQELLPGLCALLSCQHRWSEPSWNV